MNRTGLFIALSLVLVIGLLFGIYPELDLKLAALFYDAAAKSFPLKLNALAAIARDGAVCAGVVLNVPRGDEFTAVKGGGAFLNGQPMRVSSLREPGRALIGTGFPFKTLEMLPQYMAQFSLVMRGTAGIRRAGSAALDLSNVGCGRFDAFWELTLAPWDVAAGMLMVQEAGGIVTDLEGNPARPVGGAFVAGNPAMHAWLLQTVRRANMSKAQSE